MYGMLVRWLYAMWWCTCEWACETWYDACILLMCYYVNVTPVNEHTCVTVTNDTCIAPSSQQPTLFTPPSSPQLTIITTTTTSYTTTSTSTTTITANTTTKTTTTTTIITNHTVKVSVYAGTCNMRGGGRQDDACKMMVGGACKVDAYHVKASQHMLTYMI